MSLSHRMRNLLLSAAGLATAIVAYLAGDRASQFFGHPYQPGGTLYEHDPLAVAAGLLVFVAANIILAPLLRRLARESIQRLYNCAGPFLLFGLGYTYVLLCLTY